MEAQMLFVGGIALGVILGWCVAIFVYPGQ